jgi:glycosyltransferase involved in cell wall biosynthesis
MRIFINSILLYGKGEGGRAYTRGLLRALHRSNVDMDLDVILRREDAEQLGLADDPRFHIIYASFAQPAPVPGLRFVWRNLMEQLPATVHSGRYDVIHYLDSYGPVLRMGNTPLVIMVHDVIPLMTEAYHSPWVRRYLATLMRRTIPLAQHIVTPSETTAQYLRAYTGLPSERITVVPNGVDERFQPATTEEKRRVTEKYHLTDPYIISVGTIEPRKNLARTVRAFAQARQAGNLAHTYLIAGKLGWEYDDVPRAIEEANLGSAIRLLGYVPAEDIAGLISGADALAYASLEEGFGLPVAEGMACGTPVITSSISSLAEVAGDATLLVDPTQEEQICDAMLSICRDEELRTRLRAASLARAQRFTWDRVAEMTANVYRQVGAQATIKGASR